ncbi:MAG: response regulator transcription factor [Lachnospiraceae bacterium]|nr:response regulator transcription factor [Lachnospiraceae bacterium]
MVIAICDEKAEDRKKLCKLLENYQNARRQIFQIEEYNSGLELCKDKERISRYQIIFLNINMEKMDGLKSAMLIKEMRPSIHIILVTSYMNDTLDEYKVKATRFLLKDDLDNTLDECMEGVLKEIRREKQTVRFQFVEGETTLKADDIIYIETNKHKNLFYTKDSTYSIYKKLGEIEEELVGLDFVRIHQSFLVNMRYVDKISSYVMRLTTGEELSVPKSRYQYVKQTFSQYKEKK